MSKWILKGDKANPVDPVDIETLINDVLLHRAEEAIMSVQAILKAAKKKDATSRDIENILQGIQDIEGYRWRLLYE